MPIFFQHPINDDTRIGIWKIEETEDFFRRNVPQHREVTHPHKRLQHLAGRFLLQFLFPDFPYELVEIAETRKPFIRNEAFHFSISHCADFAAAIVSRSRRVGVDIEVPVEKVERLKGKFLSEEEMQAFGLIDSSDWVRTTALWSAKEAVYKWYGDGQVDFRQDIHLQPDGEDTLQCEFLKTNDRMAINCHRFESIVLAWVIH